MAARRHTTGARVVAPSLKSDHIVSTRGHDDMERSWYFRTIPLCLRPHSHVHDGHRGWAVLGVVAYGAMIGVLAWVWAVTPALALVSATGYVRVVTQASNLAYLGANRAALISTVAQAAAVTSPASMAVRLVTGPIGWAALGVSAGLVLAQMYYSAGDLQAVRTAAAPPTAQYGYTYNGTSYSFTPVSVSTYSGCPDGKLYYLGTSHPPVPPGMYSPLFNTLDYCTPAPASAVPGNPTQQNVQDYLSALPPSDPNAIENHTTPLGVGTTPTPASSETATSVSPTELPTTVKPVGQVGPTDAVVDPNVPKPAGTENQTATQSTTTTTTTMTNPDGSKTDTQQDSANVSCSSGQHDARSFGSILQAHITTWQGSGILSALSILQTLTWPDALPTITFTSSTWGTHQVDFNQWASVFTVLRTLTIAGAGFAAYRIIFVGNG